VLIGDFVFDAFVGAVLAVAPGFVFLVTADGYTVGVVVVPAAFTDECHSFPVLDSAIEVVVFAVVTVVAVAAGAMGVVMGFAGHWTAAAACGDALVLDFYAGGLILLSGRDGI
jgi:hypothetical protein